MRPYLDLYNNKTERVFRKYFDTEFERDKFARKLKYSVSLQVLKKGEEYD